MSVTWSFNASPPAGSPAALVPRNSGMSQLAASGNALTSRVGIIEARTLSAAPIGAQWSMNRTVGSGVRSVTWDWRCAAKTQSDLYGVLAILDQYMRDGGLYALTDGTRSSEYAKLTRADLRSRMVTTPDGRWLVDLLIAFEVTLPQVGADKL